MPTRKETGNQGEKLAAEYLKQQGYVILETNWRRSEGEFDLIARQGEVLVFVEVRTRYAGIEAAFESISKRKKAILERLSYQYLTENQLESSDIHWRIDVIGVTIRRDGQAQIAHSEDAFDW